MLRSISKKPKKKSREVEEGKGEGEEEKGEGEEGKGEGDEGKGEGEGRGEIEERREGGKEEWGCERRIEAEI